MTILIDVPGDDHEVKCQDCEAIFTIIWRRSADVTCIWYCPFCGEFVEDETTPSAEGTA